MENWDHPSPQNQWWEMARQIPFMVTIVPFSLFIIVKTLREISTFCSYEERDNMHKSLTAEIQPWSIY